MPGLARATESGGSGEEMGLRPRQEKVSCCPPFWPDQEGPGAGARREPSQAPPQSHTAFPASPGKCEGQHREVTPQSDHSTMLAKSQGHGRPCLRHARGDKCKHPLRPDQEGSVQIWDSGAGASRGWP
eukprot:5475735-Amphidinium_carterae.1